MDWKTIEKLIDQYYEADTSLEEENTIRTWLKRADCPEHLLPEQFYFQALAKESEQEMNPQIYSLTTQQTKNKTKSIRQALQILTPVAAASILFLIIQVWKPFNTTCIANQEVLAVVNNQRICNEKIAEEEAREALEFLAQKLNKTTEKVNSINK